jgi:dTMP kinase
VTVLLRIEPEAALGRGQQRLAAGAPDGGDRFEGEGIEFQRAIAAAYDEIARRNPDRIVVVDASREVDEVHRDVIGAVESARARARG